MTTLNELIAELRALEAKATLTRSATKITDEEYTDFKVSEVEFQDALRNAFPVLAAAVERVEALEKRLAEAQQELGFWRDLPFVTETIEAMNKPVGEWVTLNELRAAIAAQEAKP